MHVDDTEGQGDEGASEYGRDDGEYLLTQLVAHLREHRAKLRQEWVSRIQDEHLLEAMTPQEMAVETTPVYDDYVEVLQTGSVEALHRYARDLSERIIPRGVETQEVVGSVLLLREVVARSLFRKIVHTLVTSEVDLSKMYTFGDLQGGLEEAERLFCYLVTREAGASSS